MAKNIEMNYKTQDGYEILYPKTISDQVGDLSDNFLPLTGGAMTGDLLLNTSEPSKELQAASKAYVDNVKNPFPTVPFTDDTWKFCDTYNMNSSPVSKTIQFLNYPREILCVVHVTSANGGSSQGPTVSFEPYGTIFSMEMNTTLGEITFPVLITTYPAKVRQYVNQVEVACGSNGGIYISPSYTATITHNYWNAYINGTIDIYYR